MINIRAAVRSHVGLVRKRNEDAWLLGEHLVAVADGLGGHVAGDVASATVIDALRPYDRAVGSGQLAENLGRAVNAANEALRQQTRANPELAGMGSTLVGMVWTGDSAALANVGDSRIYLLRGGELQQLTDDHIYERLVAEASDVPNLPERLARFLDGRADGRSPDLTPLDLHAGDRILLCSDGLSSYVTHDFIQEALDRSRGPDEATDRLIELAIEQGAPDNVTVIVSDARLVDAAV
jgi:serine/threonine protein phosphatase PrpC